MSQSYPAPNFLTTIFNESDYSTDKRYLDAQGNYAISRVIKTVFNGEIDEQENIEFTNTDYTKRFIDKPNKINFTNDSNVNNSLVLQCLGADASYNTAVNNSSTHTFKNNDAGGASVQTLKLSTANIDIGSSTGTCSIASNIITMPNASSFKINAIGGFYKVLELSNNGISIGRQTPHITNLIAIGPLAGGSHTSIGGSAPCTYVGVSAGGDCVSGGNNGCFGYNAGTTNSALNLTTAMSNSYVYGNSQVAGHYFSGSTTSAIDSNSTTLNLFGTCTTNNFGALCTTLNLGATTGLETISMLRVLSIMFHHHRRYLSGAINLL